jgi:hypothetical protein
MKKLLLLDADVIIDLHSLGLFDKMTKAYDIQVTKTVFEEAKYYPKKNAKIPIDIKQKVTVIDDVDIGCVQRVQEEAREAMLTLDPGETTVIAYIMQFEDDIKLCLFDKAAIKVISYMNLEEKSVSLESALRKAGHHTKLLPRHLEKSFKECIKEGKALRMQFKKLF